MTWYMVWGSEKRPKGFMGGTFLDWSKPPIGVYSAETAQDACIQAAKDSAGMGTFFAIEGFAWGTEFITPSARALGQHEPIKDLDSRLSQALDKFEETTQQIERVAGVKEIEP